MFRLDALCVRPLRFILPLLTLACLLLPIAALAQAPGTCDGMQLGTTATTGTVGGALNGFVPFPPSNLWNTNIAGASIDPNSGTLTADAGTHYLAVNFGNGTNATTGIPNNGIPYIVVDSTVNPLQPITVYGSEASKSDVVIAPFPNTAGGVPIGGTNVAANYGGNPDCDGWPQTAPTGDNLALVLDRATCWLYETRGTTGCNGQYEATSETIWDMTNGESRPWGWPSANDSGFPVFPGLVRYDEANSGSINHALAFSWTVTEGDSNNGYFVLPASYAASTTTTAHLFPMGTQLRLKASVDISAYGPINQAILSALQNYGMILTDIGPDLNLEGVPDARWSTINLDLAFLLTFPVTDFDVIQMSPEYKGLDAVSAYTATNPEYGAGHAIPVINSFTVNGHPGGYTTFPTGYPVTLEYSVTGDSYDYIDNIGPVRLTGGSGSVSFDTTTTTEYTLYSTNAWGRASNTLELTVNNSVVTPPVFNPTPAETGILTIATQKIVISTPTSPSATIYYTTNGSTPTTSSTKFTGSLTVQPSCAPPGTIPAAETVSAIAVVTGYAAPSAESTATYSCGARTATPTFSPAAGTYTAPQTVTISDATGSAAIYYTTDGSTPTTASTVYSAAISVAVTQTLEAIAVAPGDATSAVGSAAYTIQVAAPVLSPGTGTYASVQTVTITDSNVSATIYYTITGGTTGTTPTTANVTQYTGPITVNTTSTIEAVALAPGYSHSVVVTAIYTLTLPQETEPTFSPTAPATFATTTTITISDTDAGATIYYTLTAGTTGTVPTNPPNAATHSCAVPCDVIIATTSVLEALAWDTGDNNSLVRSGTYTLTNTIVTPTFSPTGGVLNPKTAPITVTISDTTAGVTIYYTTDGTTPTTASTHYTAPIPGVFNDTTLGTVNIRALAVKTGDQNSTVGTITYYFEPPTIPEPTFSPGSGVYAGVQTVTISDSTAGTTIYYTVTSGSAGTTPTTASSVYSVPISVTPTSVVEAMATKLDSVNSTVAVATYSTESPAPTPTFNPPAGSYAVAPNVTIGDGAPGAAIYYTTNGTTPTTASARFSVPIPIVGAVAATTVEAIATATNYTTSAVGIAVYTIPTPPALTTPTPGTQLPGTNVAFSWTPGSVATHFELWLGSTGPGSTNLYNSGVITSTTATVNNLPDNGEVVYARLYYLIFGTWYELDYTYTAAGTPILPAITSPTPSTTLAGTSVPFTWSTGNIATEYQLVVGTGGVDSSNIYVSGPVTVTTETVNNLPNNGMTVNVRLSYLVNGSWESTDYVYTATGGVTPPALTTPTPNTSTPLTGTSVTFAWTPGNTATHFEFWLGSAGPGTTNLYNSGSITATSVTVGGLPNNGETLYARLYYLINGTWKEFDYTYVASGAPTLATLTTPTPSSKLGGTTVQFKWNPGNRATNFELWLGSSGPGTTNLYDSGSVTVTTETVSGLPDNGETLYARLYSLVAGTWKYEDYTYTAAGTATAAALTTPTPNTTVPLSGTSVAFAWNPGNIATSFEFWVGTGGAGSSNLYNSGAVSATTETVSDLPNNGQTFNARLYYLVNGVWKYSDYTYVASGSATPAALTTPTPNTLTPLTGASVAFTWTPGNTAKNFEFYVGTSVGSSNIYNSGDVTVTTETVGGLPTNGSKVYVRLYWLIKGAWKYADYTYVAY